MWADTLQNYSAGGLLYGPSISIFHFIHTGTVTDEEIKVCCHMCANIGIVFAILSECQNCTWTVYVRARLACDMMESLAFLTGVDRP